MNANDFYLDYVNNWLTVSRMAEHYGITQKRAYRLITLGRHLNHQIETVVYIP
jgi:hypothetical protein